MAYLDLHSSFTGATAAATPHFAQAEWQVIMLAEKEGLGSLSEPGPVMRLIGRVFGLKTVRRLANPRLEALRRFSVLAWHYSYALPVSAIAGLRKAGFSDAQLEYALASIASVRSAGRRRA